jgi:hypothetical protein
MVDDHDEQRAEPHAAGHRPACGRARAAEPVARTRAVDGGTRRSRRPSRDRTAGASSC